jgi:transcription termination/antitermination protein NusG
MNQVRSFDRSSSSPWYVVRVKANAERKVAQSLTNRGLEVFLPLQKRPSKRKKMGLIEIPLFAGYIFSRFTWNCTQTVLTCEGVVHILSRGSVPEPVDPDEMRSLLVLSRSVPSLSPLPAFTTGQKVKITEGPLADVEGIVLRDSGRQRLIVSVSLLRRSVVAEIDREWVEDINPPVAVTRWLATGA